MIARSRPAHTVPSLYLLRVERPGQIRGMQPEKAWVARVDGPCERYGLRRAFIAPMNDWRDAHRAWSGNVYGIVHTFPLREGNLYEVARHAGRKQAFVRQFIQIKDGKQVRTEPLEALALAEGDAGRAVALRVEEAGEPRPWVAEIRGLGMPRKLGFVLVGAERLYRLREGRLYEISGTSPDIRSTCRFVAIDSGRVIPMTEVAAQAFITSGVTQPLMMPSGDSYTNKEMS